MWGGRERGAQWLFSRQPPPARDGRSTERHGTSWDVLTSVIAIRVAAPTNELGSQQPSLPRDLLSQVRGDGIDVVETEVRDRTSLLSESRRCAARPGTVLVLVVAHGKSYLPRGGSERSFLLAGDTDLHALADTAVDLEDVLRALSEGRREPLVVVVDACAVRARQTLDSNPGPLAVLLAAPDQRAEAAGSGPILSRAVLKSLTRATSQTTWEAAFAEAVSATRKETADRQCPEVMRFGSEGFWRTPIRPVAGGTELATRLEALVNRGELDPTHLDALLVEPRTYPPSLQIALLAQRLLRLTPHDLRFAETERSLDELVRQHDRFLGIVTRASAQHALGWALWKQGANDRLGVAAGKLSEAHHALDGAGWDSLRARIANTLGYVYREQRAFAQAARCFAESMEAKQRLGDKVGIQISRNALAWLELARGRYEEGRKRFGDSYEALAAELDAPRRTSTLSLEQKLVSIAHSATGLLTACLLVGLSAKQLRSTIEKLRAMEKRFESILPWEEDPALSEFSQLRRLLSLRPGQVPQNEPAQSGGAGPWASVALCLREGAQRVEALREEWLRDTLTQELALRMKRLAAAELLCLHLGASQPFALRRSLIERMRDDGYDGIPSPFASATRINTESFPDWGPLRARLEVIRRPDAAHDVHTLEKYLL